MLTSSCPFVSYLNGLGINSLGSVIFLCHRILIACLHVRFIEICSFDDLISVCKYKQFGKCPVAIAESFYVLCQNFIQIYEPLENLLLLMAYATTNKQSSLRIHRWFNHQKHLLVLVRVLKNNINKTTTETDHINFVAKKHVQIVLDHFRL